ncbi:hypothetical protein AMATHDRAFT_66430 [Amanita thiersii Skay4041]|uniref:Uncharacterized protein n=1 Tax=Amanita thiersii Skay4041 TaxID=703135 RepID=A0A2A9NJT6_9AGAR|nr:hypothetical protein AMATHDRAFT_66430 [Amanita thiersii Skay4041]
MTSLNVGLHERDALSGLQIDFTITTLASLSLSFMQRKWDPYPILVQLTRVLVLVKRLTYVRVLTIRFESDSYARDVDGRGTDPTRRVRGRKEKRDGEGVGGVGERWAVMLSKILELVVREKGCREVRVLNHSFWIREVFPVLEEMGKVGVLAAPVVAIRDWARVGLSMDWARGMRQLLHSPLSLDCFLRGRADGECKQMTGLKSFLIQSPILLLPPTLGHTAHLFSHSPALTSLTLSRLSLLPRLFADALVLLVSSLTNPLALRSLSIQSCETLTLPLLLSILHHLPAIETLRVDLLARRYFHKKSLRLLVPPLNKLRCLEAPSDYVLVLLGGRSVKGRFEKLEKVWVYPRTCWTAAFGYKRSSVEMKKIVKRVIEIGSEGGEVELALDLKLAYLTYRLNMRADIKDRMDEIRRWEGGGKGMSSEKGRGGLGLYDGTVRESMFYVVGSQYGDGSDGAGDGAPWIIDEGLSRIGHRRGCGLSIGKRNKSWSWGVHVSHVAVTWHDIVKDDLAVLVMWVRTLFPRVVSLRLTAEISGVEEWERTRRGGRCVHLPREGSMFEGLSWGGALTPSGEHEFVFDVEDMGGIVRPEHGERDNGNGVGRVEKRALELIVELKKAGCTQIEWVTVDGKRYATQ